jgi:hypothetical protein
MRSDRIIEKRAKWQDYLDPEEDPGLLDDREFESAEALDDDRQEVESDITPGEASKSLKRRSAPETAREKPAEKGNTERS